MKKVIYYTIDILFIDWCLLSECDPDSLLDTFLELFLLTIMTGLFPIVWLICLPGGIKKVIEYVKEDPENIDSYKGTPFGVLQLLYDKRKTTWQCLVDI